MYMRIKCDDLIEHVNNLMKNYAVRASKKVDSCERKAHSMCLRVTSGEETALAPNAHDELADVL